MSSSIVTTIEYRGYSIYEVCSLVRSGQAHAMGYGQGRMGAYNWIDAWYDKHGFTKNGIYHPKPDDLGREYLADKLNTAYPNGEF